MSIVSLSFFLFLTITAAVYWLYPGRSRWLVLLAAGGFFILFHTAWDPALLAIFAGEVLLTWLAALAVSRLTGERAKTAVTALAVLVLAGALIWYKELSFFVENFNRLAALAGAGLRLTVPETRAPFGVSYYTLTLIAYLLDVRWGTLERPERNPLKMLLFAGYFPQLTSGPVTRYSEVAPALLGGAEGSLRGVQLGLQRLLWGLFKKLVLADRLAPAVAALYDGEQPAGGLLVPLAAVLYIAQLYMDFSGCMDIALGAAELFGAPLPENFRRPFAATNLSELWRRWHMTLGLWVKDYVLYPLLKSGWMGAVRRFCKKHWGKRASRAVPTYIGLFVTWFCVGFWHGGSWKYIFGSGLFFFFMIAGGMLLEPVFRRLIALLRINTEAWSWKFFQQVRSFCLFAAAVSFDRQPSFSAGLRAWRTVFTQWNPWVFVDGTLLNLGLDGKDLAVCALGFLAVLAVSMLQERFGSVRELLGRQNLVFRWLVYLGLFLAVVVFGCYGPGYDAAAFIYAGF